MGDNPLEPKTDAVKPVDVLAAAAGVPTPTQVKGTWALVRKHRKLAMLLAGVGVTVAAGGYGIKYFRADPGKAHAQPDAPAVAARPDQPAPFTPDGEDRLPLVIPVKAETPAPDVPKIPDITPPDIKPPDFKAPTGDKPDVAPPLLLPPMEGSKKPAPAAADVAPPPIPDFKLPSDVKAPDTKKPDVEVPTFRLPPPPVAPATDKKKAEGDDVKFQAPDLPPIDPKKVDPLATPAPLPATVHEKKDKAAPVIRVNGVDPPPAIPDPPRVDVPAAVKKDPVPAIPTIDIPPPPATDKKDPPIIVPPPPPLGADKKDPPAKDVVKPSIDVPTIGGEKNPPILGPAPVDPLKLPDVKTPEIKIPDGPPVPTINLDPPPTIGSKAAPPAPEKKDNYYEDWHTWKAGDTYALISQEYYHDGKYAAALEAYNKEHRKPGDPIVRVPELWRLEEMYAGLVGKPADKPLGPPEVKPAGGTGIKFEPVAPLPGSGRTPAIPTSRSDEYKVTAEAGETIREVARKALGNPDAWRKLSTLNPDLDPTLPIPAGTVVRLPK